MRPEENAEIRDEKEMRIDCAISIEGIKLNYEFHLL